MLKIIFYSSLLVSITGCSLYQISSEETTYESYPQKESPTDVKYYPQLQNRSFKLIGFVTVSVEKSQSRDEILLRLKKEAAKMGGDGITNILIVSKNTATANKFTKFFTNASIRESYSADVIVFEFK